MRSGKFKTWWNGMNKASGQTKIDNFHKWLSLACRTVALRGDQNQQRVVYTITNRFRNSEYKKLSRENALRVYRIVNTKIKEIPKSETKQPLIVKKRTTKKIVGSGRQKANRPNTN